MAPESRTITGRDARGRFRNGVSGNAGGRPKSMAAAILDRRPTVSRDLVDFWSLVAFGSAAGFIAINAKDEAAAKCPSYPDRCSQEGTDTNDRAQTWATISTVSLIGGGVMLAGGAFLFFTASPSRGSASIGITKAF